MSFSATFDWITGRAWLAMSALLLSACGVPTETQSKATGAGPTVVSLNPCIDAILVEVADPGQILALSHYSRDPASSSIPSEVATRFSFSGGTAEEVLALDPDIVLASSFMAPATRQAFERLGVRVESFGSPNSAQESIAQVRELARLVGKDEAGKQLVDRMDAALDASAAAGRDRQVETILWQSGQIVAGDASLVTETLRNAGFLRGEGFGQGDFISLESMLAAPPELLLVSGESIGQRHPALAALDRTHVDTLDPTLFYCGGPSLIALADRLGEIRAGLPQ